MSSITNTTPGLVSENPTIKDLNREIAYAKEVEASVHKSILPTIEDCLNDVRADKFSRQDLEGMQENIFSCIKEIDKIIESYNKKTDDIDLLLNLISKQNKIFSNVLYNGTLRGNDALFRENHLDYYQLNYATANVRGTYYPGSRDWL
jgi:hypothetical protein